MPLTTRSPQVLSTSRARARLAAAAVFVALMTLTGCASGPAPHVTVTVQPSDTTDASPTPVVTPDPDPVVTPEPDPIVTPDPDPAPAPDSTALGLTVTQGELATECTSTVCHYVHLQWSGLTKGNHQVQCVSDASGVGVFSDRSIRFDTTGGERELGCFLGHPGSKVWVVIDGTIESLHADWP